MYPQKEKSKVFWTRRILYRTTSPDPSVWTDFIPVRSYITIIVCLCFILLKIKFLISLNLSNSKWENMIDKLLYIKTVLCNCIKCALIAESSAVNLHPVCFIFLNISVCRIFTNKSTRKPNEIDWAFVSGYTGCQIILNFIVVTILTISGVSFQPFCFW